MAMKPNKLKSSKEPSLRAKLSAAFLEALEMDFREHGKQVIERMRESHPERYCEVAAKMISTIDQPDPNSWESAQSMQDIGRKLLQSVGTPDDAITDQAIEDAVAANDEFIAKLELIRDAQGSLQ
jgi:hypothetical protein